MSKKLVDAMVNMKEKEAVDIAKGMIQAGEDPLKKPWFTSRITPFHT